MGAKGSFNQLKSLARLTPGRTESRIVVEFSLIALSVFLHAKNILPFATLPLILIFIASRQHALLVLMHESAHRRVSTNRLWNDIVGEAIAWQFLFSMQGYRRHHLLHHVQENLNTPLDPDWLRKQRPEWVFPMKRSKLFKILAFDLLLLNSADYYREAKDAKNNIVTNQRERLWKTARLAYFVFLATALWATGGWKLWLLYWLLPLFTIMKAIFRIRSIADHFGITQGSGDDPSISRTRTILSPWYERFLIAPCSIGIHGPHHMYAWIPYYNLRKAHEVLSAESEEYRTLAKTYSSYYEAMQECLDPPSPKIVRVESDAELELYRRETSTHLGVNFPMEYLRAADVYVLRTPDGKNWGGFMFVKDVPLRTLLSLPEEQRNQLDVENYVELTGLWLSSEASTPWTVLRFWLAISRAAWPYSRNRLIFTYSASKTGLGKIYSVLKAQEIYNGETPLLEGMSEVDVESINETPCLRLSLLPVMHPEFYWKRLRVRLKNARKKA